jgi:hypothetical protein
VTETEILKGLHQLGIGASNHRLVLLLPLVQVAWADDTVQLAERERILEVARQAGLLDDEGFLVLEQWLLKRPSDDDLALGRDILVALAHRQFGLGQDVTPTDLDAVRDLSVEVAKAAGGLFGIAFSISPEERATLDALEADLAEASEAFLEQLPTPDTGRLEEL